LVVVLVVLALMLMLLVTFLVRQQPESRRTLCQWRQQDVAKALFRYHGLHGRFPGYRNLQATDAEGTAQPTGWVFPILPHLWHETEKPTRGPDVVVTAPTAEDLKRRGPYNSIYLEYGPEGPDSSRGRNPAAAVAEMRCPADPPPSELAHPAWSSWVVNAGRPDAEGFAGRLPDRPANGVFFDEFAGASVSNTLRYIEQHDGLENTLLLTENVDSGDWTDSTEANVAFVWVANVVEGRPDPAERLLRINQRTGEGDGSMRFARPSSHHVGGVNVVYCNGRTQWLSQDVDYEVFLRLMTPRDEEARLPGAD